MAKGNAKHRRRMRIAVGTMCVWAVLTVVWSVLLWPSITVWVNSIPWIVAMSWWANVSASAANFTAALMMWMQMKDQEK